MKADRPRLKKKHSETCKRSEKMTQFIDVLAPAETSGNGPGLYFVDYSSAAAECVTLQAGAGLVVHLFPTGQGNIIGNPTEPVIKLSGTPCTVGTLKERRDLDVRRDYCGVKWIWMKQGAVSST